MSAMSVPFERRIKRIVKRGHKRSYGSKTKVTKTGLIVVEPRIYQPRFPYRTILALLIIAFSLKCLVYIDYGPAKYADRVAAISGVSPVEKAAAWILQADPVTVAVGNFIRSN